MNLNRTKSKLILPLVLFLLFPFTLQAAMRSDSYIIYENVHHTFDGPVISGVGQSVSGTDATITWNTDVIADAFVVYDTDSGFGASKEQGSSVKSATSHSVAVSGLSANTTYYYRVRSQRVNGGLTTDMTSRSFTTGSAGAGTTPPTPASPSGGGGILVIDKTDKEPPVITDVAVSAVSSDTAVMTWETDEEATSFVEYGQNTDYGATYGQWATSTSHSVTLINLQSETDYNFRVLSSDSWGNVGYSVNQTFITIPGGEEPVEPGEVPVEPGEVPAEPDEAGIAAEATRLALEFIGRLFPEVSLNELGPAGIAGIGSLEELSRLLPMPIMSGEPNIEIGASEATISWSTDIEANSLVAIAPADRYNPGASEPYLQVVGDLEANTTEHEVTVYGLAPDAEYHFQLRNKASVGPTARSRDFVFRTSLEELTITSFFPQIIDEHTAVFKWVTNKESDSTITFAPYHGNILALDESKTIRDNTLAIIHEIKVEEFIGGTFYDVELQSVDVNGNVATESLDRFSTAADDSPPEITHIKADSTVFLDRSNKIQTIIAWLTNEPSTSRVYYQEGVQAASTQLAEATPLNTNYTKEHVMVITKFKPGVVYSFRVESIDSGGNVTESQTHTFMTAKQKESIIQIILNILEEIFGWVKKIM